MKHLDTLFRLSTAELQDILRLSADLKAKFRQGGRPPILAGHVLALLFEKPSLRTRISFEVAMTHLGGSSIFLSAADAGLNGRESLPDVARVLSCYCDCIVIRAYSQAMIEEAARYAECPIINGLSDVAHPCQAIADVMTIQELFGPTEKPTIAFVGDGNNVARSLALAGGLLGMRFIMSAPPGYEFTPKYVEQLKQRVPDLDLEQIADPKKAVAKADVIYTDVWASMGQEAEADKRKKIFAPYQVNAALMSAAPKHAKFLHCLPARRGMEVTDDVMDGPQSAVFEQAENRLHSAKGALMWLMGKVP